ncbi:MAG: hypothetical protein ABSF00_10870 [Candidatus Bathyarchaeia archaeon]|jgi:hypothetical protein
MKRLPLLYDLIARAIIVIVLTDAIIFYLISTRYAAITGELTFWIILVTLIPLTVNIWFDQWRYDVLKVA